MNRKISMSDFSRELSFVDIDSSALRDFYGTWLNLGGDAPSSSRRLNLEAFGQHVRHTYQIDYSLEKDRFWVRFSGSQNCSTTGIDSTGKFVDEVSGMDASLKRFRRLVATGKPNLRSNIQLVWAPDRSLSYDVISCPLFDEGGRVSSVLFMQEFYENRRERSDARGTLMRNFGTWGFAG